MKKVSMVVEKLYQNNVLFDKNQTNIFIKDNSFAHYHVLYDMFRKNGYEIATDDIHSIKDSEIVFYIDLPKKMPLKKDICKSYLIMTESPVYRPDNFNKKKHKYFNKIFTWHDDLVDNEKYFKFNYCFVLPKEIPKSYAKFKLCCLIAGNKYSNHPNELYSERKKLIRWFENNHPNHFDLYGVWWNQYRFKGIKPLMPLNRFTFLKNIMFKYFGEKYPSYKGEVVNKFESMQGYKFAICYENIKNVSGYITEKIFYAMFAGCVPVYWGADNITDHIPKECFVDKRNFKTYETLYQFMKNMDEATYINFLNNIENFLNSVQGHKFSAEFNAEIFIEGVR